MNRASPAVLGFGLVAICALQVASIIATHNLHNGVEQMTNGETPPPGGETHTTGPWLSGGIPHTHTTTRQDGETAEAWAARHDEGLQAFLLKYPVDPK